MSERAIWSSPLALLIYARRLRRVDIWPSYQVATDPSLHPTFAALSAIGSLVFVLGSLPSSSAGCIGASHLLGLRCSCFLLLCVSRELYSDFDPVVFLVLDSCRYHPES